MVMTGTENVWALQLLRCSAVGGVDIRMVSSDCALRHHTQRLFVQAALLYAGHWMHDMHQDMVSSSHSASHCEVLVGSLNGRNFPLRSLSVAAVWAGPSVA
jgi:hypothetical protein